MQREKLILKYLKPGQKVLDIGSVGQNRQYSLWNFIKKQAGIDLTGIDTERSEEENIIKGDMEKYRFNEKFDLIVAGDVLEHVKNQNLFLLNIRHHLKPDGIFILSTPNTKWPTVFLKPNKTHNLWHDKYTLSHVLEECKFEIVSIEYYYGNKNHYNFFVRPLIRRQGILAACKI